MQCDNELTFLGVVVHILELEKRKTSKVHLREEQESHEEEYRLRSQMVSSRWMRYLIKYS